MWYQVKIIYTLSSRIVASLRNPQIIHELSSLHDHYVISGPPPGNSGIDSLLLPGPLVCLFGLFDWWFFLLFLFVSTKEVCKLSHDVGILINVSLIGVFNWALTKHSKKTYDEMILNYTGTKHHDYNASKANLHGSLKSNRPPLSNLPPTPNSPPTPKLGIGRGIPPIFFGSPY